MSTLTADEINKLRSRPHNTKLYMSIFQPKEVFSGRLTGTVSKGMRQLSFYSYSGTTFQAGITALVGTTPSGYDKGKIRVRELDVVLGTATVAENSDIDWQVGDYFTVIGYFEIWPIYPRIILDTGSATTLWYKDYDVAYDNQNSELGFFINMGSHYAGFLDNGQCNVYYTAEGTEHVRADETGTTYYWTFGGEAGGRSPTTYYGKTPGYVSYTMPGHFLTRLIVSGSVTQSADYSNRCISIHNRPGSGTFAPIANWEMLDLSGSRDQGGYTTSIRIHEPIPETAIRDGSLVVIFADDRYGTTDQHIGGNAVGRENVVFTGYVMDGTIRYNYRDSSVEFKVVSPSEIMKKTEGYSVSVQSSVDPVADSTGNPDIPSGWICVLDMDIKRAIYHYLKWHTTVMNCCDISYLGTNQLIQYFDADRESIFDAVNTLMNSAIVGKTVSDRQGKLWFETDIYHSATGSFNTGLAIAKTDWMGDPNIEERSSREVSYLEMGGIAYAGGTGSYQALMSAAPGTAPSNRGRVERVQGLALLDQTQLNTLVGDIFAQLNAKYPNLELEIAGNYRNFDIAPQERIPITIAPTDTVRGITFTNKDFFVQAIQWQYDPEKEFFHPVISLEELTTNGIAGDTLAIVTIAPTGGDFGGFTIPPIVFPPIEIPPFPVFDVGTPVSFVPADAGYSPGATYQTVGQINPYFVIFMYAGNAGVAYGRTKVSANVAGTLSAYAIVQGYDAGNVNVQLILYNITQGTAINNPPVGTTTIPIVPGIQFILLTSIAYNPNDIIMFQLNYADTSAVDLGVVGWSL